MASVPHRPVTIAVDAMGGDHAPEETILGVAELSLQAPNVQTILVGDEPTLTSLLSKLRHDPEQISIHHASTVIRMDEKPAEALEQKPDSSINVAVRLVA